MNGIPKAVAVVPQRFNDIVYHYESATSTNDVARELASSGACEGTTIVAEEQTAGRGRLGRAWHSPRGEGLYHTIILRPTLPAAEAPALTLMASVAVVELARDQFHVAADIRWPNDVLVRDRKLAGILAEIESGTRGIDFVLLGIGMNLNQTSFPPELVSQATSLRLETSQVSDPDEVRRNLYSKLDLYYDQLLRQGPSEIIRRWCELSSYAEGKAVKVTTGDRILTGVTCGLSPQGALIVETPSGARETILTGDVQRLRKDEVEHAGR